MTTTDLRPRRYEPEPEREPENYADRYDDDYDRDEEPSRPEPSAAEREVTGELVQGELAGQTVYCPPTKHWRASALHALREGDFETWAKVTLEDDDWEVWEKTDPTLGQIEDFFSSINPKLGTSPGNSRSSRRSSRNTRRR